MAVKNKSFSIWAKLHLDVSVDIPAVSLEEAVQKSKELKEQDFVEILGEFNDGELEIVGIHKSL